MKSLFIPVVLVVAIMFLQVPFAKAEQTTFEVKQTITGTTPPPPPPPTPTTGPTGGNHLVLVSLSVIPGFYEAFLNFSTNIASQATVSWGTTPDYELGSLAGTVFLENHFVHIQGLSPNTLYYFKIELKDMRDRVLVISNQQFRTLSLTDTFPPQNVSNLKATPSEKDITLTWKNPKFDFDSVRIVRSDKFFPKDPFDGSIIYEGEGEKFVDTDVVIDQVYYYAAFAKDISGNFSSGAVVSSKLLKPGELPGPFKPFAGILELPRELLDPLLKDFSILDIDFIQEGKKLPVVNDTVNIRGDINLMVSIDYHKIPEILKTIAVTMYDPEDPEKTFSFLLRVNKEKTAYEAHLAPLEKPGSYKFALAILDHRHQGLASFTGTIIAFIPGIFEGDELVSANIEGIYFYIVLGLVLLLILILVLLLGRRRKDTSVPIAS